jgi:hypothetical protein
MKLSIVISIIIAAVVFAACSNSDTKNDGTESQADSVKASAPLTMLKATKQYVTNADGTVTEIAVNAEIGYNEQEVVVTFKDSADKSFTLTVASMQKKVEGIHIKTKERKYTEVFISSGAEPQVTFSREAGGNMTLM